MKVKTLAKYYNNDLLVKIFEKDDVIFTGKINKIPVKLFKKNVVDVNPTLNKKNKIVIEFKLGKED